MWDALSIITGVKSRMEVYYGNIKRIQRVYIRAVITQNIDELHQKAGSKISHLLNGG